MIKLTRAQRQILTLAARRGGTVISQRRIKALDYLRNNALVACSRFFITSYGMSCTVKTTAKGRRLLSGILYLTYP